MQSEKQASEIAEALKSELRQTWEKAAPGWAKWEHIFSAGLSTATETLLDAAGIRPGMRVLDLACGAGSQTIEAAKRVGSDGGVVACDISATMLDHVRKNAAAVGLQNIETLECAAEELDETLPPFDAAICRLGLMLFPSPGTALKAMQRVLKPGARFAALVVTTPANNPFMAQTMAILLRCAGKSRPKPGQPGIFALGENGILENLMQDSGLVQVQAKPVTPWLSLPNASHALEMMQEAFGAYRAVVADLSDAEKSKAWGAVYACLKQFERMGGFQTPVRIHYRVGLEAILDLSRFCAGGAGEGSETATPLCAYPSSKVISPQSITPPRSIDQSEGFKANSLPSLTTYASIADPRCRIVPWATP